MSRSIDSEIADASDARMPTSLVAHFNVFQALDSDFEDEVESRDDETTRTRKTPDRNPVAIDTREPPRFHHPATVRKQRWYQCSAARAARERASLIERMLLPELCVYLAVAFLSESEIAPWAQANRASWKALKKYPRTQQAMRYPVVMKWMLPHSDVVPLWMQRAWGYPTSVSFQASIVQTRFQAALDSLPQSIRRVKMCSCSDWLAKYMPTNLWTASFAGIRFPSHITSIWFDTNLARVGGFEHITWPERLESLEVPYNAPVRLLDEVAPLQSVRTIHIGISEIVHFASLQLPSNLTHLHVNLSVKSSSFEWPFEWPHLPESLELLQVRNNGTKFNAIPPLPSCVTSLDLQGNVSLPTDRVLPELLSLRSNPTSALSMDPLGWKCYTRLETLWLGHFDGSLLHLPDTLCRLTLVRWNRPMDQLRLPSSLTELAFGHLNQVLDAVVWPPALTSLRLGCEFQSPLDQWHPPVSLMTLHVGSWHARPRYRRVPGRRWNPFSPLKLRLPPNLVRLTFGKRFYTTCLAGLSECLPSTLQYLNLGGSRAPLPPLQPLPANLVVLHLPGHFCQSPKYLPTERPDSLRVVRVEQCLAKTRKYWEALPNNKCVLVESGRRRYSDDDWE